MDQSNNHKRDDEERREKIRKRYKGGSTENAEYTPAKPEPKLFDDDSNKRIAVYVRVSTQSTQQLSSYEMQQTHYSDFVSRQKGWELVKIYADEGISGTSLKRRDAFRQMIEDCKKGGIDLIVVKSVSRFSRNVVDAISSVEMLAELTPPVGVFFENERIYSLSSDSEFLFTLTTSVAAEESRVKSVTMNSSLKMRFSHRILLTPPLLGYDNDKDGNLIINEEEAETVRLIFSMYLYGHTCNEIAETLTALNRKTKPGNTKWSSCSVLGVLKNERHCGHVRTWKTFTPNYKTHKSRKNCGNREQYTYRDNHAPIISTDDYIAVQKMIANAKYGGRCFMPVMRVSNGGALHGFVSVNPRWGAFKTEDYLFASRSVGEIPQNNLSWPVQRGEVDLRGYEVTRTQFFNSISTTSGIFSIRNARFSGECIRKLGGAEYIELLVHPTKKLFAVRECSSEHRNAIRWAKLIDDKMFTRQFGGTAFLGTLYDILGWNSVWGYKLRGAVHIINGEPVAFFDAQETEVLIPHAEMEMLLSANAKTLYISAKNRYRTTAMPVTWQGDFGVPYYKKVAENAHIDKVSLGANSEHNTEPDVSPTAREVLSDNINRILTTFRNRKAEGRNEFTDSRII